VPVSLDLDFDKAFAENRVGAYERLLLDVIAGRLNLFVRSDEQEEAWAWVEPILRAWQADDAGRGPMPRAPGDRRRERAGRARRLHLVGRGITGPGDPALRAAQSAPRVCARVRVASGSRQYIRAKPRRASGVTCHASSAFAPTILPPPGQSCAVAIGEPRCSMTAPVQVPRST
jgi:hypothetical protein